MSRRQLVGGTRKGYRRKPKDMEKIQDRDNLHSRREKPYRVEGVLEG